MDLDDINSVGPFTYKMKTRLAYTAMTRPSKVLVIKSDHDNGETRSTEELFKSCPGKSSSEQAESNGTRANKPIDVYSGDPETKALSNFAPRPFTVNGVTYANVEQAFQSAKMKYLAAVLATNGHTSAKEAALAAYDKIMATTNATEARKLGRTNLGPVANEAFKAWDAISYQTLYTLMDESFKQNPDALQALIKTGDAEITHNRAGDGRWKTDFPAILMDLRSKYAKTTKLEVKVSNPESALAGVTVHSGGASGADLAWGNALSKYGADVRHYGSDETKANNSNVNAVVSPEELVEGENVMRQITKKLFGEEYKSVPDLIKRDWKQAKECDAVFAVGVIAPAGSDVQWTSTNKRHIITDTVIGGTAYAVNAAIMLGKPVYVYDQSMEK